VGDVWLSEVSGPDSTFAFSIAQAVFAPGARLDWHSHPGGQFSFLPTEKATIRNGVIGPPKRPRKTIHKGELVKCQPGVEHWHGATPTSGVTYLATSPAKGKTIWFKRVTDEEYGTKK